MEMWLAKLMEIKLDQQTEHQKEMSLAYLSAELMVLMITSSACLMVESTEM